MMALEHRSRVTKLRDGSRVRLRPICGDDKLLLVDAFERLSDDSRYRRYFSHVHELAPEMLAYLTEVDHVDHEAIIAIELSSGEALGVARFIRRHDDAEEAEIAFAVIDDWQGRGLGRALLTELARRARRVGVHRFTAVVLYDNDRAIQLLNGISEVERRSVGPEMELAIDLPEKRGIGSQLAAVLRAVAAGAVSGGQSLAVLPSQTNPPAQAWESIRTVLVGCDGSPTAAVAVQAAADVAGKFDAVLHVVTAYRLSEQRTEALNVLAAVEAEVRRRGLQPRSHAVQGEAAAVLIEMADELAGDVVVVGSKGMNGAARFRSSVPNVVSHHAPCSVMIVHTV